MSVKQVTEDVATYVTTLKAVIIAVAEKGIPWRLIIHAPVRIYILLIS